MDIERLPALIDPARKAFAGIRHVILAGTNRPAAMFAYPGKPRMMEDPGTAFWPICDDPALAPLALEALCDALGARKAAAMVESRVSMPRQEGGLTPDTVLRVVAAAMPEQAIIVDESISAGRNFFPLSQGAPPHDYLQLTAGALGSGIPVSAGAALACPDRLVITMEGDGSAAYTLQGLWTQAREGLKVLTIIFANRRYNILDAELRGVGVSDEVGARARRMLTLDAPHMGWVELARGFGVEGERVSTAERLHSLIASAAARQGPFLIEAVLP